MGRKFRICVIHRNKLSLQGWVLYMLGKHMLMESLWGLLILNYSMDLTFGSCSPIFKLLPKVSEGGQFFSWKLLSNNNFVWSYASIAAVLLSPRVATGIRDHSGFWQHGHTYQVSSFLCGGSFIYTPRIIPWHVPPLLQFLKSSKKKIFWKTSGVKEHI